MTHSNYLKIAAFLLAAAFMTVACGKDDPEKKEDNKPSITCSQTTVMRGEDVTVKISGITDKTEVTVKFGREKTITQNGPGSISYAFENSGAKTITVTTTPDLLGKTTYKVYVEKLLSLKKLAVQLKNNPNLCLVMAHRGNSSDMTIPENSIAAVEKCVTDKVDIMEMDLYTTKDGVLVVSHDAKLDRETTGTGNIKDKTLNEIKNLKLKDRQGHATSYKMLTFDELLEACKGRIYVNVDLGDRDADIGQVLSAIESKGMNEQCLVYVNSKAKITTAFQTNFKCNAYTFVTNVETLVEKGQPEYTYFTQCTWEPTTPEASRTGKIDPDHKPTSATSVAKAANKGTIITVNAIYTTNTAQFWSDDFKLAQVEDIFSTYPSTQCLQVDTPAEARAALAAYGRTLLNN